MIHDPKLSKFKAANGDDTDKLPMPITLHKEMQREPVPRAMRVLLSKVFCQGGVSSGCYENKAVCLNYNN